MADSIKCPECRADIPLSEVISHQIEEQLATELARSVADRERELNEAAAQREAQLTKTAAEREEALRREFEEEREKRDAQIGEQAANKVATELADLRERTAAQEGELKESRGRELELLQQKRQLVEEREKLDLEIARRLDEERQRIASETRQQVGEQHQLDLRQKDLAIEQMQKQIKDLQESSEQTRAGLIGEAQEREIEGLLSERFRTDLIEPIKAGVRGADVLQTVVSRRGETCGRILWESKRARNWSSAWIPKLKEDQAEGDADVAVLVCSALPGEVRHMELMDGVWVVSFSCVVAMASALREGLIGVSQARSIDANRNQSLSEIYDYLTSNEFGRRMRTIIEAFVHLREDLDSERRAMERIWTKRAKQIDAAAINTAGIYGDLEAVIGAALPTIETLELPAPVPIRSAS
jgi:hypothetical protein